MKQLKIFFSDAESVILDDEDDRNIEEYISELTTILESNNISILHTSSGSIVIRPNTISAITVSTISDTIVKKQKSTPKNEKKIKKESDVKPQDIISD